MVEASNRASEAGRRGDEVVLNSQHAEAGDWIALCAKGVAHLRDRPGIRCLQAGHDARHVIARLLRCSTVAIRSAAGYRHSLETCRVAPADQFRVRAEGVKRHPVTAVTAHAAKGLDRMRSADLFDAGVTGQAEFRLARQRRSYHQNASVRRARLTIAGEGEAGEEREAGEADAEVGVT